jgi:hypothetical protein
MNNGLWLPMLGGLVLGSMLGGGGTYRWLTIRLKREAQHRQQMEQARQFSAQQLTQARRQVEQLQRDNQELRQAARPQPSLAPVPLPTWDAVQEARQQAEALLEDAAPFDRVMEFKDTEVMTRG